MRGIVARREHHPRIRPQGPQGKGKLRSGPGAVKEVGITSRLHTDHPAVVGKVGREMSRIPGNDKHWFPVLPTLCKVLLHIGNESPDCPVHVVEIHGSRAVAGKLRAISGSTHAALHTGHHLSNRSSPQSTRPEGQGLVESIVELRPVPTVHQLHNCIFRPFIACSVEEKLDVPPRISQNAASSHRFSQSLPPIVHGHGSFDDRKMNPTVLAQHAGRQRGRTTGSSISSLRSAASCRGFLSCHGSQNKHI